MNYRDSFVSEENSYHNVSSPEIAEDEGEIKTPIGYHGRTRPRRSKRDSMSSVDSNNSSDKLFEDKSIDEELKKSTEPVRKGGKKRGRKPSQMNLEAKLERSRQSARECRARKKLRYQSLEDTIAEKEARVYALRREVQKCVSWAKAVDEGTLPQDLAIFLQKAQGKSED